MNDKKVTGRETVTFISCRKIFICEAILFDIPFIFEFIYLNLYRLQNRDTRTILLQSKIKTVETNFK